MHRAGLEGLLLETPPMDGLSLKCPQIAPNSPIPTASHVDTKGARTGSTRSLSSCTSAVIEPILVPFMMAVWAESWLVKCAVSQT